MFDSDTTLSNVKEVENETNIESTDMVLENITLANLKIASEMFMYLNTCPDTLRSWILLYTNMFKNQSPDKILLTLNRILTGKNNPASKSFKSITRKLMKRTEILFGIQFKEIGRFFEGNSSLSLIGVSFKNS